MKKSQLIVAVAVAGLLGMSARAASLPDGYCSAKVKLTAMVQGPSESGSDYTKYTTTKVKVVSKDMLVLIADEFGAPIPEDAQLVINYDFWYGTFAVLTKDGDVILSNASDNESDWELYTDSENYVYKGKDSADKESYSYNLIGEFWWDSDNDSSYFDIYGDGTIKDSYKYEGSTTNFKHSYKLNGAGNGAIYVGDVYHPAVFSGSISGKGVDQWTMM